MLSEEEMRAIEFIQEIIDFLGDNDFPLYTTDKNKFLTILDLLEKQQKELSNLKEIEQLHKEENGKLRVEFEKVYQDNLTLAQELEQEKEKNKELEEKLKIATAMLTKGTYPEQNEGDNDFDKQFIAVDKIKEKIEEIINSSARYNVLCKINENEETRRTRYTVAVLKELLEE